MGFCYALGAHDGHSQGGSLQRRGGWNHPLASFFELRGTWVNGVNVFGSAGMGKAGQPTGDKPAGEGRLSCLQFRVVDKRGKGW